MHIAALHLVSVFQSLEQRHFIGIFQHTAYGQTECKTGYLYTQRLKQLGNVHSRCLALNGGVGRHNDLFHAALLYAGEQLLYAYVVGGYAVKGGEQTVQDVVNALVFVCALESGNVLWRLNDAYCAVVASVVVADWTDVILGEILAYGAVFHLGVRVDYCVGECLCLIVAHGHYKVCQSLCGFHTNSGELCKLLRQQNKG